MEVPALGKIINADLAVGLRIAITEHIPVPPERHAGDDHVGGLHRRLEDDARTIEFPDDECPSLEAGGQFGSIRTEPQAANIHSSARAEVARVELLQHRSIAYPAHEDLARGVAIGVTIERRVQGCLCRPPWNRPEAVLQLQIGKSQGGNRLGA